MDSKEVEQTRADMPAPAPYAGPDTADWLRAGAVRGIPDTHPKYPVPDDPIHPNYVEPWLPVGPSRLEIARPSDDPMPPTVWPQVHE